MSENDKSCPIGETLQLISGKWKAVIIHLLGQQGVCRFSQLDHQLPCSRRMLALQLSALQDDGLVAKHIYPVEPPKTSYSLTDKGKSILPVVEQMQDWGSNH
ncbi:winged helix-turn-helix transcriptional regulator [Limosilactobacillus sp.]|uniref:winged helix-turn-helix transcriptional regulator n=1 Tax=Limosilactobacillus sp. TaxID=2773925 RepID=UPI00345E7B15